MHGEPAPTHLHRRAGRASSQVLARRAGVFRTATGTVGGEAHSAFAAQKGWVPTSTVSEEPTVRSEPWGCTTATRWTVRTGDTLGLGRWHGGRREGQSEQPSWSSASVHHTSRIQHEDKRWRSGRGGRPTAALVAPADVRGLMRRFDPSNPCKASRSVRRTATEGGTPLPDIHAQRSQGARQTGHGGRGKEVRTSIRSSKALDAFGSHDVAPIDGHIPLY